MYEDVLIATDGSEVATNAATVGLSLARTLEATVHGLSVVEQGRDNAARRSEREAAAESVATDATEVGCNATSVVREGRPATEILAYADEADVDLLVVGTHGRTGVRQLLFGSVALEVIRESHIPVLSISPAVAWNVDRSVDDVLLATDGWTGSDAATDHAIEIADACDARLRALYAVDVSPDPPNHQDAFEEHGEQATAAVANRAEERGVETTRTVEHGPADDVILDHAEEQADLLVMGTESKTNLERLVIGSVSQRVVPNATVPVLTARTVDEETS